MRALSVFKKGDKTKAVVNRKGKNDLACHVIEIDSQPPKVTLEYLKHLHWIKEVTFIPHIDF